MFKLTEAPLELSTFTWVAGLIVLFLTAYCFITEPFNYWKKVGLPYTPYWQQPMNVVRFFTTPMNELVMKSYKKYGRMYGTYQASDMVLSLAEPDLVRDVLVKDFQTFRNRRVFGSDEITENILSVLQDEKWKRVRTIVSPTFTTGKMRKMTNIVLESAKTLSKNLKEAAETGKPFDAKKYCGAFTMDVIATSAFATKIDSHNDPENPFVVAARMAFAPRFRWKFAIFLLLPSLIKLFRASFIDNYAMDFFKDATLRIIEERKRTGKKQNDFLQLLMDASEEAEKGTLAQESEDAEDELNKQADSNASMANGNGKKEENAPKTKQYKGLSHNELVAQCVIFFLAGYETTASTISYAMYSLAVHPEVQEKLIAEVDEVLRENENQLTYDKVQNMKYLDNVVSETLRMYPPAVVLERKASVDYTLKDTEIRLPKGTVVMVPSYAIHHDPEFYPDPEKFDPSRFDPDARAERNPYTYLPFGAGPRNCVAMRFALMEVKLCLAYLLSRYRFKRVNETKVPIEFTSGSGLLQTKEILLGLEKRKGAVASEE